MLGNPPLPMVKNVKDAYMATMQPAYITGEVTGMDDLGFQTTGKYDGFGGAFLYNRGITDKWGFYVFGLGSTVEGNFYYGEAGDPCSSGSGGGGNSANCVYTNNAKATYFTLASGATYQLYSNTKKKMQIPIFFGPTISKANATGTVVTKLSNGPTDADWDFKADPLLFGLMAGIQFSYDWGKFRLIPFFITNITLSEKCHKFEFTSIRKTPSTPASPDAQSSNECGSGTRQGNDPEARLPLDFDQSDSSLGLNITYIPWNLTVNVTSPFIKESGKLSGNEVTVYTLSWSFGTFDDPWIDHVIDLFKTKKSDKPKDEK